MILALSLFLAALLGFAAHRASVCTVRAVAEVLSTRRAYCLASFLKSVLWVLVVTLPLIWLMPRTGGAPSAMQASWLSVGGGLLFGMGAALNGGCAFSTLTRLADGQIRMLVTLLGFVGGTVMAVLTIQWLAIPSPLPVSSPIEPLPQVARIGIVLLWGWAIYEIWRLWSTRPSGQALRHLLSSNQYRLSTAAALMGLANGLLFYLHGPWAYSGILRKSSEGLVATGEAPSSVRLLLMLGVLAGMMASKFQRGSFRLDARVNWNWPVSLVGGTLMGFGAELVPGGNDVIILHGMPMLSQHAVPSYLALLLGIAVVLLAMRAVIGREMRVDCRTGECVTFAMAQRVDVAKQPMN